MIEGSTVRYFFVDGELSPFLKIESIPVAASILHPALARVREGWINCADSLLNLAAVAATLPPTYLDAPRLLMTILSNLLRIELLSAPVPSLPTLSERAILQVIRAVVGPVLSPNQCTRRIRPTPAPFSSVSILPSTDRYLEFTIDGSCKGCSDSTQLLLDSLSCYL